MASGGETGQQGEHGVENGVREFRRGEPDADGETVHVDGDLHHPRGEKVAEAPPRPDTGVDFVVERRADPRGASVVLIGFPDVIGPLNLGEPNVPPLARLAHQQSAPLTPER